VLSGALPEKKLAGHQPPKCDCRKSRAHVNLIHAQFPSNRLVFSGRAMSIMLEYPQQRLAALNEPPKLLFLSLHP